MTTRNLALAIALSGMIVTGIVIGQTTTSTDSESEWDMISQQVASPGQAAAADDSVAVYGTVYLFNRNTGKVYKVWAACGDDGPNGCLEPLPVVSVASTFTLTPEATSGAQAYQPQ